MLAITAIRFIGISPSIMPIRHAIFAVVAELAAVAALMALGLMLPATPSFAHHSVAAEFDLSQRITLEGLVTKIEWMNPHVYVYVDVNAEGKTANWACETAGPNTLARQGWSRSSLKIGDRITVVGFKARDGSNVASAREIVLSNGRKVFVGSPYDGGPPN
jgi:hypothetical protein